MRTRWVVAVAVGTLLAGCGDDDANSADTADSADDGGSAASSEAGFDRAEGFVGELEGTDAFVAVVAGEDEVEVYACDGASGFAARLTGEVDDPESFTLTNDAGDEATVEFVSGAYTGTITLADGTSHDFTTVAAEGDAGLYHAVDAPEGLSAGWVVLNDGSQRGSILFAGGGSLQIVNAPPIQGRSGEVSIQGLQQMDQMAVSFGRARP